MKIVNLKDAQWAEARDALNLAIYHAQNEADENGVPVIRASLKLDINSTTGSCLWKVAADSGSGNMETKEMGKLKV